MIALKKKNNKFLSGLVALIVAVAMVSVGVTLALYSSEKAETNVLTIGDVDIELEEEFTENQVLSPGTASVTKVVTVTNTGNLPCYARILVRREWRNGGTHVDNTGPDNEGKGIHVDMIKPNYPSLGAGKDWYKGDDVTLNDGTYECYYYKNVLGVGDKTSPLMSSFDFVKTVNGITFDTEKYGGYTGVITVYAQAIQSSYLADNDLIWSDASKTNIKGWGSAFTFAD